MFLKHSRYQDARRFEPAADGSLRCKGTRAREIGPAPGVIEHVVREGDRLDLLAGHYYNDPRLWWRILDANPDLDDAAVLSMAARAGEVILIPRARD
ncbi:MULTISPECIES: LysM peptidoglycan-binding domain-containing protein [Ideonella]|jgi:nucleoid-associated protein YgaU|uniref:LysM peptidoglycan-binding domain-containing protein n=1 Tax=Ideonella oryzae TaxID=2937441 RepID=A0ABT1BND7_9BURK|nr:LysM domain-containing protein [Ideonella oryzae]MCO5977339.1 LysM peptidoglycan-binding domain-containing protein [Ideonella oryzae]